MSTKEMFFLLMSKNFFLRKIFYILYGMYYLLVFSGLQKVFQTMMMNVVFSAHRWQVCCVCMCNCLHQKEKTAVEAPQSKIYSHEVFLI